MKRPGSVDTATKGEGCELLAPVTMQGGVMLMFEKTRIRAEWRKRPAEAASSELGLEDALVEHDVPWPSRQW